MNTLNHILIYCFFVLRLNGTEVGSFYDQNHESNHKNSMVGQSVLIYCNQGDKVQVNKEQFSFTKSFIS